MSIAEFYQEYDIWAFLFAILRYLVIRFGERVLFLIVCYPVIRFGVWLLFLVRTRRRVRLLNVDCSIRRDETNYPCKLWMDFRNWTNKTLLMKIEGYKLPTNIRSDPKATRDATSGLLEVKFIERAAQQNTSATLNIDSIIRHGESKGVWVPLDPDQPDDVLNKALAEGKIGKIKAEICGLPTNPFTLGTDRRYGGSNQWQVSRVVIEKNYAKEDK